MTRNQMIEWLIDNDIDSIQADGCGSWLRCILSVGFEGYENQTDEELKAEILERDETAFDEENENA
jgi:hypothetical protein